MKASAPLFRRYPLRAENLRHNLKGRRRAIEHRRERLDAVRFELFGWAQWRQGFAAAEGLHHIHLDEPDRARAITTPGDAVRFYLETVEGVGWADLPMRRRWRKLHWLYRRSFRSQWSAEDFGDLRRRMMALLVDAQVSR